MVWILLVMLLMLSSCYWQNAENFLFYAEKHGTCSYPVVKDEYSYFSTALDLYFKYNVTVSMIKLYGNLSVISFNIP